MTLMNNEEKILEMLSSMQSTINARFGKLEASQTVLQTDTASLKAGQEETYAKIKGLEISNSRLESGLTRMEKYIKKTKKEVKKRNSASDDTSSTTT